MGMGLNKKEDKKMKTFKTSIKTLAALLIATAATTACTNDDNATAEPTTVTADAPKTYTMTVAATMGGGETTTRALGIDASGALNATWTAGDKVYVSKDMGGGTAQTYGTLTATNVSADGLTCTLTGELTTIPAVGYELTLRYNNGGYVSQQGTLDYIATNCDNAEATVTVATVADGKVTTTAADFQNQQAIVKFTLKDGGGAALAVDYLTVKYGSSTYKVTPAVSASEIFVAIPGNTAKMTLTAYGAMGKFTYEKAGVTFDNGKYYAVGVKMQEASTTKDLSTLSGDYTASDGELLTGTLSGNYKVSIADDAIVILKDVTINGVHVDQKSYKWAGITCAGSATIILEGTNTVKGFHYHYPGIYVPKKERLTIKGSGSLDASSNGRGAGIGGGKEIDCGDIRIEGGNITATSLDEAAGIGSAGFATCGSITITGGTVTATGGDYAAGIGSGQDGKYSSITIGKDVTSITATAGYDSVDGNGSNLPPIGKGANDQGSGSISIDGTTSWTAGTATEHFNWAVSTVKDAIDRDITRWTLTHK